ncbi:MAG: MerR family transcriptional regulator [Ktedonobacterales bacterium]
MPSTSTGLPVSGSVENTWLGLHEASALLGISLSTMRRWADAGKVPVYRTVGGHRRFQRQELELFLAGESTAVSVPAPPSGNWSGDEQDMNEQEWHRKVSARPAADRMRGLGQRLLGLLIQHVHSRTRENRFLNEASAVGTIYGKEAFNAAINLHETVKAFLFFRRACSHLTSPANGIIYPADLAEAAKLQDQIDAFMDTVLLGVLAGYESQRLSELGDVTPAAGKQDKQQ